MRERIVYSYLMPSGQKTPTYARIALGDMERKVKNRVLKERLRGGTKDKNHRVIAEENNSHDFFNKIICGDNASVLESVPANSVDIIITSPPYNFGLDYDADRRDDAVRW